MKHIEEMLDFLYKSPSCFHAVDEIKNHLNKAGYEQLDESQKWKIHAVDVYKRQSVSWSWWTTSISDKGRTVT